MDYPRDVIMQKAHNAIRGMGGPQYCKVFFKFTCIQCGTRCTFDEPNSLFERGECAACGFDQPVEKAGFRLEAMIRIR